MFDNAHDHSGKVVAVLNLLVTLAVGALGLMWQAGYFPPGPYARQTKLRGDGGIATALENLTPPPARPVDGSTAGTHMQLAPRHPTEPSLVQFAPKIRPPEIARSPVPASPIREAAYHNREASPRQIIVLNHPKALRRIRRMEKRLDKMLGRHERAIVIYR